MSVMHRIFRRLSRGPRRLGISIVRDLAVIACVAGCSSPDPTYYTLQPVPGLVLSSRAHLIEVVRPGLAGYLDRSDIVLKQADFRLSVNDQLRWGEPLGDMIGRVLAQDLTQRLPGSSVFSNDGAIGADPDYRMEINVLRFDVAADGSAELAADVAIEKGLSHTPLVSHQVTLHSAHVPPGAAGLAASMSHLLGELADRVAGYIANPL